MSKQSDLVNITQGDADINGGTIDGTVIGGSTPAAISGTTGQFDTSLNVDGTITSDGLTVGTAVYPTSGALSNRNKIINGNFDIWQRGTSGTASGTSVYVADRWKINAGNSSTAGTQTLSRQAFSAQELGATTPQYFSRFGSSGASGGTIGPQVFQRVERDGARLFDGARTWSVSFWAKSSDVSTLRVRLAVNGANYYANDVTLTAGWQRFERTIIITANDNTSRLYDELALSMPTGVNGTVDIAQVQLEAGDTATPFEHRSYGQELALCQRYYYKLAAQALFTNFFQATWQASTDARGVVPFPVTMRATPSVNTEGSFVSLGNGTYSSIDVADSGSKYQGTLRVNGSGGTAGNSTTIRASNDSTAAINFNAEL